MSTAETVETPIETTQVSSYRSLDCESKEGKSFLRKVIRETKNSSARWIVRASPERTNKYDGWQICFSKTVEGRAGDPDVEVTVWIDQYFAYRTADFGEGSGWAAACRESDTVVIPHPKGVYFDGSEAARLADCILKGYSCEIYCHRGSINSSRHGIGFVSINCYLRSSGLSSIKIGESITVNGQSVCSGAVYFR